MKKYIFKDGQELRGIVVSERMHSGFRYEEKDVLIDEDLGRHIMDDMPELERITFVKGIDKDFKKAFVAYKEANQRNIKRREEIEIEIRELNKERGELNGANIETLRNLEEVYKEVSGLYTNKQFLSAIKSKTENFLKDKYDAVKHGISTTSSSAYAYGNSITLTIPVDMVRHPQDGLWDLFLEYDNTLHSYGDDMTSEVLKVQHNTGFDLNATKQAVADLNVLDLGELSCRTSIGDKIATLETKIILHFDLDKDFTNDYLEEIMKDIKRLL